MKARWFSLIPTLVLPVFATLASAHSAQQNATSLGAPAPVAQIYYSSFNGSEWADARDVPEAVSSTSPALAEYLFDLYMVWTGAGADTSLYYNYFDGASWTPVRRVPEAAAGSGPALAVYLGDLYAFWMGPGGASGVGRDTDTGRAIYYASLDGSIWTAAQRIPGIETGSAPALCEYLGDLYMFWTGGGKTGIYYATFDGAGWSAQRKVPGAASSGTPALAEYLGRMYVFWRGVDSNASIYYSYFDASGWTAVHRVPEAATGSGPQLAEFLGDLYLIWRGPGADPDIYESYFNGVEWTIPDATGFKTTTAPGVSLYPGALYMAWPQAPQ